MKFVLQVFSDELQALIFLSRMFNADQTGAFKCKVIDLEHDIVMEPAGGIEQ